MRGDHAFVGVYSVAAKAVTWAAPSTGIDRDPVWSPDGAHIAFTRQFNNGGAPEPLREDVPQPWAIVVAEAASGAGHVVWSSPRTLTGSYPGVPGGASLRWAAGDRLVFRAEFDGWAHLYTLPAAGGAPTLLTPGPFIVEDVTLDRRASGVLYTANTGATPGDDDRRHVFRVGFDGQPPAVLTHGEGLEYLPAVAATGKIAYVSVTAKRPASLHVVDPAGHDTALRYRRRRLSRREPRRAAARRVHRRRTARRSTANCSRPAGRRRSPASSSSTADRRGRCCSAGRTWAITRTLTR